MSNGVLARQVNSISSNIKEQLEEERSQYLIAVSQTEERILRAMEIMPSLSVDSNSSQTSVTSFIMQTSASYTSQDKKIEFFLEF